METQIYYHYALMPLDSISNQNEYHSYFIIIEEEAKTTCSKRFDFAQPTKLPVSAAFNFHTAIVMHRTSEDIQNSLQLLLLPCWWKWNCCMSCNRQFGGSRASLNWCLLHCFLTTISESWSTLWILNLHDY